MIRSPIQTVALLASLVAVGGSVAAQEKGDENAEPPKNAKPAAGPAMMGGMGGDGRVGRREASWYNDQQARQEIARLAVTIAQNEENPQTRAVLEALDRPFTIQTGENWNLADLVEQIRTKLTTADGKKTPVYVDPRGLEDVDVVLNSRIEINLEDIPLKLTLRLALKQVNLAYCVREGVIIISSPAGVLQELKEAEGELMGLHPNQVLGTPGGLRFMGSTGGMM